MAEAIIRVEGAEFRYEGADEDAVSGVSVEIAAGEFVAVLGRNGSGKSTLAKLLNALILPKAGEVYIDGVAAHEEKNSLAVRKMCGMVFQNPDNQIVATIVEEDCAFGPENIGVPPAEIRERVDSALRAVGMEAFRESAPHMLSGGQKQRVAIAGVLAMRPSTLVLDEPVAGLDPAGREELLKLIQDIHKGGVTVIMVTHSMDDAARLCGRLIVLNRGEVAFDAPPAEVFRHGDELVEMGLDVPECVKLVKRLNECGFHLPDNLFRMEDVERAILKEVCGC